MADQNNLNNLRFKVNNKEYDLDTETLDSEFNNSLKQAVSEGRVDANDLDKYNNAYTNWKNLATNGQYSIDRRGDSFGDMKYTGKSVNATNADLGINESGETAKPSYLRRKLNLGINTNKQDQTMAYINDIMGNAIAKHSAVLDKQDLDAKNKVEADQKLEADNRLKKFKDQKFDIFSTLYGGRGDISREQALNYHWNRLNDKQRSQYLNNYWNKVGSTIFDKNFDDENIKKSLLERGLNVDEIRNELTAKGWKEGKFDDKFKGFGQNDRINQLLGNNIYDDAWFNKPQAQSTNSGTSTNLSNSTDGGTTKVDTNPSVTDEKGNLFTGIKDGKSYYNGVPTSSFIKTSPGGWHRFYAGNKEVDEQGFRNYALGLQPGSEESKNVINAINSAKRNQDRLYAHYTNINENTYPESGSNSAYVFNSIPGMQGKFTGKADNITGLFENIRKGNNYHLIEFANSGPTGLYTSRYMLVDRTGKKHIGRIGYNGMNENIFTDESGKQYNLGRKIKYDERNSVRRDEFMPFSKDMTSSAEGRHALKNIERKGIGEYKEGGSIRKFQIGGSSPSYSSSKQPKPHEATMKEAFNPNVKMSSADKWMLGGLAADTAGLVASLTGVGSVAGAGLGAAGTTASLVSDIKRDGFQWGDAGNAALGYGMDVLSAIPGLGIGAKTGKIAKTIRGAHKALSALMIGAGATGAANVVMKITKGEDVSISDWRTLASGFQAAIGGHRMIQNVAGTKRSTSNFINATINGKKQKVQLDESDINSINSGKTEADKIELAKLHISEKLGIKDADQISLDKKLGLKLGLNPFTKNEKLDIGTKKGDVILKNIDDYKGSGIKNRYMRHAITSAAAQNPNAEGAKEIVGDNFTQLGILGHHTRMNQGSVKTGNAVIDAMNNMKFGKGVFNKQYNTPAGPADPTNNNPVSQLALPQSSGKKFTSLDPEEIKLRESDIAKQTEIDNDIIARQINNERLIRSSARLSSVSVKQGNKNRQRIADNVNREIAKRNVETKIASEKIDNRKNEKIAKSKEISKDASKKVSDKKTSELKKKQLKSRNKSLITNNNIKSKASNPIVVTKSSGVSKQITKDQSNTLSKIKPENRQSFIDNNFEKGGKIIFAQRGTVLKKRIEEPMFLNKIVSNIKTPTLNTQTTGIQPQVSSKIVQSNNPIQRSIDNIITRGVKNNPNPKGTSYINQAGNFIKNNVNPIDLSEFARATATSNMNKNVDTNVKAPVFQHMAETPVSIRGNYLAKLGANSAAANLISNTANQATSDSKLNRVAMNNAYNKANEVTMQGELANSDSIQKQEAMNSEMQGRYAQNRNTVANQNIEAAAKAADATRELNNIKNQMVYQPYDEFWKNMNAKKSYEDTVNKNAKMNIAYNEMIEPIRQQMINDTSRYDSLYTKSRNSETPLTDTEKVELNNLENSMNNYKTKSENILYNLQLNPRWRIGSNYWGMSTQQKTDTVPTKGSIVRKKGGSLTPIQAIEKLNNKISSEFAKKIVTSAIKENKEDVKDLEKDIKNIDHLRKLIFKNK